MLAVIPGGDSRGRAAACSVVPRKAAPTSPGGCLGSGVVEREGFPLILRDERGELGSAFPTGCLLLGCV